MNAPTAERFVESLVKVPLIWSEPTEDIYTAEFSGYSIIFNGHFRTLHIQYGTCGETFELKDELNDKLNEYVQERVEVVTSKMLWDLIGYLEK